MAAGRHAVDKLLQVCEQSNKLSADDLAAVRAKRQLLIDRDILSPETVQYSSYEQLRDCGFTHGVAVCLKRVFPTEPAADTGAADGTSVPDSWQVLMEKTDRWCDYWIAKSIIYGPERPAHQSAVKKVA
jgi:hypothetical protein